MESRRRKALRKLQEVKRRPAIYEANKEAKVVARGNKLHSTGLKKIQPGEICIKLPGKQCHYVSIKGDERVSGIKGIVAKALGVKEQNWAIYTSQDNQPLKIVEDTEEVSKIDKDKIHFYPKVVIR